MTERTIDLPRPSATALPGGSRVGWLFLLSGATIALFAVNLFILEPLLSGSAGPRAAQFTYIIIRVAGLVGLAFGLAKTAKCNRAQTLSTVLLVGFLDQVILKGIWIQQDLLVHPETWAGIEPTNAMIFLNMAIGYLSFVPLVLILAFVGMELTRFSRDWKVRV